MKFILLDDIIEQTPNRIVVLKQVSLAEEYLADHFPTFPVLPGVLMIETMVQAARRMLSDRGDARLVLGEVKALKFGSMVRPGQTLVVEVTLQKSLENGSYTCKGIGRVRKLGSGENETSLPTGETAVSGRFTMRPIRKG